MTLKDLVKTIFSDEKTKAQFLQDPDRFLSRYALTEQEKKAVMGMHSSLGLVTGESPQLEAAIRPTTGWFSPPPVQ